jgi:hypothetical protein
VRSTVVPVVAIASRMATVETAVVTSRSTFTARRPLKTMAFKFTRRPRVEEAVVSLWDCFTMVRSVLKSHYMYAHL